MRVWDGGEMRMVLCYMYGLFDSVVIVFVVWCFFFFSISILQTKRENETRIEECSLEVSYLDLPDLT